MSIHTMILNYRTSFKVMHFSGICISVDLQQAIPYLRSIFVFSYIYIYAGRSSTFKHGEVSKLDKLNGE